MNILSLPIPCFELTLINWKAPCLRFWRIQQFLHSYCSSVVQSSIEYPEGDWSVFSPWVVTPWLTSEVGEGSNAEFPQSAY